MNEVKLVAAALKSRMAFEMLDGHLTGSDVSPEGSALLGFISTYYEVDPTAQQCDPEVLGEQITREITSNKMAEAVCGYLGEAKATDVSAINVAKELLSIKAAALGMRIASRLASGRPGDVTSMMSEYVELQQSKETSQEEKEILGLSATDLVQKHYKSENLIHLWPNQLNEHLDGGVRGGHHILVFAPTEMGKTLVVINMCAGFLKQNLRVLYVGNEDPAADIMMRMINRLTGMNKYEVRERPDKADALLDTRGWKNFIFADLAPGTFGKINQLVKRQKADVVVLDQLHNIDVDDEQRTNALEKAATQARNLAKRHNIPVISVTQAGDSATGRLILRRGDVNGSNVGIPGQCDVMLGIGADEEMEGRNMRVFSFPKNKLSGRHSTININIDPLLSKVL